MGTGSRAQRGMGLSGFMFAAVLVIFFGTLAVKLGPSYASYWTLKSVLNDVAESPEPIVGGRNGLVKTISSRMYVNDVKAFNANDLIIQKEAGGWLVRAAYEDRKHLFFNVDAVLTFEYEVTVEGK